MTQPAAATWQPVALLARQFRANVAALATRAPELAGQLRALPPDDTLLAAAAGTLQLARRTGETIQVLANPVPPQAAEQVAAKLYPGGACNAPVIVAGLDQGWLWQALYALPAATPATPGHRPPLYFLAADIARLGTLLHLHDWRTMLADQRVQIFAGPDAFAQLRTALLANPRLPWPRVAVTVDPVVWPAGESVDALVRTLSSAGAERLGQLRRQLDTACTGWSADAMAERLTSGRPLKILGVTSRYTTFLQHSMRDWLAACARLGHETRLIIEAGDHEQLNNLVHADACADFRPDLILLIDHYRAELGGAFPAAVPCVMWVQDQLPNINRDEAGAAQGERDYCLGFGRLALSKRHGYPARRFMPATVPVNDARFTPERLTPSELARYGCDASFVSHASAPAEIILSDQLRQMNGEGQRLFADVYEQLKAVYDAGGFVTQPLLIRRLIEAAMQRTRTQIDAGSMPGVMDFFNQRINNALFRHQSLAWLAELGIDLRLYGRGWESHPTLKRFARGPADNQSELSVIYRASRINLQATPHGAVHQRLLDGLAAGGFFLIRYCPGDVIERVYRQMHAWCQANDITSNDQIRERADDPQVCAWLAEAEQLLGFSPFDQEYSLYDAIQLSADGGYIRSAGAVFGDDYEAVAYASAAEARAKIVRFLDDEAARQQVVERMRAFVIGRFTYVGTTRRLIDFIAADLRHPSTRMEAAA